MAPPVSIADLKPNKILVRGVNWLGDAVMTTPALHRLRQRFPEATITLLVPAKLHDLFERSPAVDRLLSFEKQDTLLSLSRKLREHAFDLGLVFPNSPRSALELWLAGVPQRVGFARPWRNWLLTHALPERPGRVRMIKRAEAEIRNLVSGKAPESSATDVTVPERSHQLYEYLHLVAALGARAEPMPPTLTVADSEVEAACRKFIPGWTDPARLLIGLNPGAEYGPAKRWPAENFAAVARDLSRRFPDATCVVFGGPADVKVADLIVRLAGGRIVSLAGKTSLRELMALLKACGVVITNDTGPMHVAAAVGTRLVVPFGSTSPELTGPGLPGDQRHTFLRDSPPCAPCFRRTCPIDLRCLTGITVDKVTDAALAALQPAGKA